MADQDVPVQRAQPTVPELLDDIRNLSLSNALVLATQEDGRFVFGTCDMSMQDAIRLMDRVKASVDAARLRAA